jgi:hypothetical protein
MGVLGVAGAFGLGFGLATSFVMSDAMAAETNVRTYQGAWLAEGPDCTEVYSSTGKGASFKKPLDLFAPAFIISGNRLRTPQATCRIKSIRPSGDRQRISLDCANAVAGNDVTVFMARGPDGSIRRYFDEQDPIGHLYKSCSR